MTGPDACHPQASSVGLGSDYVCPHNHEDFTSSIRGGLANRMLDTHRVRYIYVIVIIRI